MLSIASLACIVSQLGIVKYTYNCCEEIYYIPVIHMLCIALPINTHICMYLTAIPSPPQNVTITSEDLGTENFSIAVSWDAVDDVEYVIYTNSSNSTQVVYTNTSNMATLEGKYNMVINVTLAAINCVGRSEVTTHIFVGRYTFMSITIGSKLSMSSVSQKQIC